MGGNFSFPKHAVTAAQTVYLILLIHESGHTRFNHVILQNTLLLERMERKISLFVTDTNQMIYS